MPETRLQMNQRLLREAQNDLELAKMINDKKTIRHLTNEIRVREAKVARLQQQQ
jgi:hypothetical protein